MVQISQYRKKLFCPYYILAFVIGDIFGSETKYAMVSLIRILPTVTGEVGNADVHNYIEP